MIASVTVTLSLILSEIEMRIQYQLCQLSPEGH